jgi:Tol biopolymer transport system component
MNARRLPIAIAIALAAAGAGPSSASATFPGHNGRIVFARFHGQQIAQLFSAQPDGSQVRELTHDPAISAVFPDRSPDGRTVVFEGDSASGQVDSEIFTVSIRGGDLQALTHNRTSDLDPAWSPDGRRIAFCRAGGPRSRLRIFVMQSDGSHARRLTASRGNDCEPQWSPDGQRVAFAGDRAGAGKSAIYTVRPSGGGVRRVTPLALDAGDPDWSPDGTRIVFESHVSTPHSSLYTIHPGGTGVYRLTAGPQSENDLFASYSPDGRKITFFSDRSGDGDIWVMDADGGHPQDITPSTTVIDFAPDWGPTRKR